MTLLCSCTRSQQSNFCLSCTQLLLRVITRSSQKANTQIVIILDSMYITQLSVSLFVCQQRLVVLRRVVRRRVAPCRLCPHSSGYVFGYQEKNDQSINNCPSTINCMIQIVYILASTGELG